MSPRIKKFATSSRLSALLLAAADQKNRVYFYENTNSPGALWVKLDNIDFQASAGVRKLTLAGKLDVIGDQTANFVPSEPFKFLAP